MEDDNDVPPLEDMSDLLQQVSALKESRPSGKSTRSEQQQQNGNDHLVGKGDNTTKTAESQPLPDVGKKKADEPIKKNSGNMDKTFGGMKKGFMFGGPAKPKQTAGGSRASHTTTTKSGTESQLVEEIPMIKPKVSQEEQYRIPEVQNAMAAGQALLDNKDWMTEDLLSNVSKNEMLLKKMGDPRFMQAMAEFQTNPTAATEKYKDNKEVQQFLQQFCGLMGEHFNKLADTQQSTSSPQQSASNVTSVHTRPANSGADLQVRSSTNPKQATADDEAKMQEILSNPEIREILLDPRIQKIIETLRTDPDKVQQALQLADSDFRRKLNKLVDCGLLQFET